MGMTMVLPFALAHDDSGGYLILLFLLFPLSYSQPHSVHFSEATLRWFGLGDASRATAVMVDDFALRHDVAVAVDTMESPLSRRLWDPGIRPPAPLHPSIGSMSPIDPQVQHLQGVFDRTDIIGLIKPFAPTVLHSRHAASLKMPTMPTVTTHPTARLRRQWDPGIVSMATCCRNVLTWTVNVVVVMVNRFHYRHPVLSRPTVPNIDS